MNAKIRRKTNEWERRESYKRRYAIIAADKIQYSCAINKNGIKISRNIYTCIYLWRWQYRLVSEQTLHSHRNLVLKIIPKELEKQAIKTRYRFKTTNTVYEFFMWSQFKKHRWAQIYSISILKTNLLLSHQIPADVLLNIVRNLQNEDLLVSDSYNQLIVFGNIS